jgi:hypothetical protein
MVAIVIALPLGWYAHPSELAGSTKLNRSLARGWMGPLRLQKSNSHSIRADYSRLPQVCIGAVEMVLSPKRTHLAPSSDNLRAGTDLPDSAADLRTVLLALWLVAFGLVGLVSTLPPNAMAVAPACALVVGYAISTGWLLRHLPGLKAGVIWLRCCCDGAGGDDLPFVSPNNATVISGQV